MAKKTQWQLVLEYLETGATITPREAVAKWDIWRLGARISDIKEYLALTRPGWTVENLGEENAHGSQHGRYKLVQKQGSLL